MRRTGRIWGKDGNEGKRNVNENNVSNSYYSEVVMEKKEGEFAVLTFTKLQDSIVLGDLLVPACRPSFPLESWVFSDTTTKSARV